MTARHDGSRWWTVLRVGGAVLVIGAAAYYAYTRGWFEYATVAERARALRQRSTTASAALLFVGAWAVATPLAFPAVPLIVAGGAIFGTLFGSTLSLAGTVLGALGGYYIGRLVGSARVRRWMTAHVPGDALRADSGIGTLVRLRLVPVVPFSTINYASGLASIPLRAYVLATIAGQLPSILLYSWFADRLLREAATGGSIARQLALVSGVLFVMSLAPWLLRRFRRD